MDAVDGDLSAWYAVYTNPRQDERAEQNLKAWGLETVYARLRERRLGLYSQAPISVIKPLFPRYIFARFRFDQMAHNVRYTRGVHSIVMFGDTAARIDDEIIAVIRSRMDRDGAVTIGSGLKSGDTVVIRGGPFNNLIGVLEREIPDSDRVQILLDSLRYQAHVEVSRHLLDKLPVDRVGLLAGGSNDVGLGTRMGR